MRVNADGDFLISDDDDTYDKLLHDIFDNPSGSPKSKKETDEERLRSENLRLKQEIRALKMEHDSAIEIITGFAKSFYKWDPDTKNINLQHMLNAHSAARVFCAVVGRSHSWRASSPRPAHQL